MVAPQPVEDVDGFVHPSFTRAKDPVEQPDPGMARVAFEQRIEYFARFPIAPFGCKRDRTVEGFVRKCGGGRQQHSQRPKDE